MSICCEKCFSDNILITEIRNIGEIGTCNYCNSENVKCVDLADIAYLFEPIISLYTPSNEFKSTEELREGELSLLWDCIEEQWQILSDSIYTLNKKEIFYQDLLKILKVEDKYAEENVGIELDYYGIAAEESDNLVYMWDRFANEIKYVNRYFISSEGNKNLLEKISEFSHFLAIDYKKGFSFFRARINSSRHDSYECGSDMESPPPEKCTGGRANPTGIPYLYVATNFNTALGEVEPILSDSVTVARFELIENIRIIKLSRPISPFIFGDRLISFYRYYDFLVYLGIQLSIPYSKMTETTEYIPTQYLCEHFKHLGYSGVQYQSLKGKGENLVIFNKDNLKCAYAHSYYIREITYKTDEFAYEV